MRKTLHEIHINQRCKKQIHEDYSFSYQGRCRRNWRTHQTERRPDQGNQGHRQEFRGFAD